MWISEPLLRQKAPDVMTELEIQDFFQHATQLYARMSTLYNKAVVSAILGSRIVEGHGENLVGLLLTNLLHLEYRFSISQPLTTNDMLTMQLVADCM